MTTFVRAAAAVAQRHPKKIIAAWLLFVVACMASGALVGTQNLTDVQSEVGQSAQADALLQRAGLRDPASENILITAPTRGEGERRGRGPGHCWRPRCPGRVGDRAGAVPDLVADGGRTRPRAGRSCVVILTTPPTRSTDLLGTQFAGRADPPGHRPARRSGRHRDKAINDIIGSGLHRAELISLPITLLILVLAFGALVAASVPLILGITAVAAAIGALGLVSHDRAQQRVDLGDRRPDRSRRRGRLLPLLRPPRARGASARATVRPGSTVGRCPTPRCSPPPPRSAGRSSSPA